MVIKKKSVMGKGGAVFGFFFAVIMALSGLFNVYGVQTKVFAEPETVEITEETETEETNSEEDVSEETNDNEAETEEQKEDVTETAQQTTVSANSTIDQCQNSLGQIGWLVCPTTGKIAEAVDWLYGKIANILTIDPIEAKDGSPIYEIWKYCRGVTNIIFIIFLLVVIYSQLTGLGISNYGIKKVLPKLIVVAILVNLSFLLCSIAVDVSNVIGSSLRGVFTSVQEAAVAGMAADGGLSAAEMQASQVEMYSALAGGTALTIGGAVIAFETGAIWMLIPVLLGALISVVTGLITIAMRQAVVALLIMISPLAVVAYMLPNTENLFQKWKKLLMQMLVFYPMFSLLFGASSLAGFAIIASAKDGFGVLLGVAVQIFPLFFSWKMMKMSGTVLGTINDSMHKLASAPLAKNQAWADSHRQLTKQRFLASDRAVTPSLRLNQYLNDRKIAREAEITDKSTLVKNRGLAYRANRNYRGGIPTRYGENAYRDQALSMEYQRAVERDKNNMNKGLGQLEAIKNASVEQRVRLDALDARVVNASDYLNVEKARGEKIEYDNAVGFHERMEKAINAHMDSKHGYQKHDDEYIIDENGNRIENPKYKLHLKYGTPEFAEAMNRYNETVNIMEGSTMDAQFAAAKAAVSYDTQKKILENAYQKYFELTPPTRDVEYRLGELTLRDDATKYIDAIIPGLRILNQRGDTDLTAIQIDNVLNGGRNAKRLHDLYARVKEIRANEDLSKEEQDRLVDELLAETDLQRTDDSGVQLGSHASQALASFLMFDVKDNDPFLRRFGKYINLETARAFNSNDRKEMNVTMEEYIKGEHVEPDGSIMVAKKSMTTLLEGTPFDGVERTAFDDMNDEIMKAYGFDKDDPNKEWDRTGYLTKIQEVSKATMPQLISAALKYLSGSEQIGSEVKFLTGYKSEPIKDENGNVIGSKLSDPIWDKVYSSDKSKKIFGDQSDEAKEVFQAITRSYIEAQTPAQIWGLRSDYQAALAEHLADEFMSIEEEKLTAEELEKREEYKVRLKEIEDRYEGLSAEEKKKKLAEDKDWKRLRYEEIAGEEIRRLTDRNGVREQLYTTRRSGAANNAKTWVRNWFKLDNKDEIYRYLERKDEERRRQEAARAESDVAEPSAAPVSVYDAAFKANLMAEMQRIYDDRSGDMDDSGDVFFEKSLAHLIATLHEDSPAVVKYKKYREDYPGAGRNECFDKIDELVSEL